MKSVNLSFAVYYVYAFQRRYGQKKCKKCSTNKWLCAALKSQHCGNHAICRGAERLQHSGDRVLARIGRVAGRRGRPGEAAAGARETPARRRLHVLLPQPRRRHVPLERTRIKPLPSASVPTPTALSKLLLDCFPSYRSMRHLCWIPVKPLTIITRFLLMGSLTIEGLNTCGIRLLSVKVPAFFISSNLWIISLTRGLYRYGNYLLTVDILEYFSIKEDVLLTISPILFCYNKANFKSKY